MVVNNHPIGYAEDSEIYVTKDKGASWKRKNVPFEMNGANLKFHATNADAILATDASRSRFKIFEKSSLVGQNGPFSHFSDDFSDDENVCLCVYTTENRLIKSFIALFYIAFVTLR